MVKDAESHADEDRRQRELAEARNVAENAAYQAEKQLAEHGRQGRRLRKEEINEAIAEVQRRARPPTTPSEIKAKTDALQAAFHKVSEQIYQAAASSRRPTAATAPPATGGGEAEEEVVDAEVVDDERS